MFTIKIRLKSRLLSQIIFSGSAYETGVIAICLRTPNTKVLQSVRAALEKALPKVPLVTSATDILCFDLANYEVFFEILKTQELLTDEDRSEIAAIFPSLKKTLQQRDSLQASIPKAHDNILQAVDAVYIEDIVEHSKDPTTATLLFRVVFSLRCLSHPEEIKSQLEKLKLSDIFDSLEALSRIIAGHGNLESSFFNMGHLPRLESQRFQTQGHCLDKMCEKFQALDDMKMLFMIVGLLMFRQPQRLAPYLPFDDFTLQIQQALTGQVDKQAYFQPSVMVLVTQAFARMKILSREGGTNYERLEALSMNLRSPLLLVDYIATIKKRLVPSSNALWDALKADDPAALKNAVSKGFSINECLPNDGRTPLIFSVQQCSAQMVSAVLECKPDVNASNAFRTFTAIYSAIKRQDPKKVVLLLAAGVDIYQICGAQRTNPGYFQPEPQIVLETPIAVALSEYATTPTAELKSIISSLLYFGAGIRYRFEAQESQFLDENTFVMGAQLPKAELCSAVFTVEDFIKKIPLSEYPHFEKVIQRARLKFQLDIQDPLSQCYAYIRIVLATQPLIDKIPNYKPFMAAVQEQNFSLALRRACVCKNHQHALKLVEPLLLYHTWLQINLEEPSSKGETPCELAQGVGNTPLAEMITSKIQSTKLTK